MEDKDVSTMSLHDIARELNDPESSLPRVAGRTLPKKYQWSGHDIPGRGNAAKRRLKQQEKLNSKTLTESPCEPSVDGK